MSNRTEIIEFESSALKDNPLKDPSKREVVLFLPDKMKDGAPLLVGLAGFGGGARSFLNFSPMSYNFTEIVGNLRKNRKLRDAVIAIPDCYTSYGGNQYINSSAVGKYEDFVIDELIPALKEKYHTGNSGLFGKSSGGFGSYTLAIRHPDVISGFADHSGDAAFEYCYFTDIPDALREFEKAGGVNSWYENYYKSTNKLAKQNMKPINILAMAAFYSPNPSSETLGIDFPFDLETGELNEQVWEKWKKVDPARNINDHLEVLSAMKAVFLDVGHSDEFNINFGMRIMHKILEKNNVEHVFEEFDGGHFNITYRYERTLSFLAEKLS